ncbi:MAG: PAS domain S-box protein [Burkholderiales bacterium]|nr:PAS domain S-box protein [Burkholderiales bacterium]
MKVSSQIAVSLAGATLLIALLVAASLWAFGHLASAANARQQSYDMTIRAEAMLSGLTDAESAQRGYLLTGDEVFLEPYIAVRDSVGGELQALLGLAPIGASHQYLEALVPLVDAKLAHMAQIIKLRREHGAAAVLEVVGKGAATSGDGKRLMDSIRAEMRGLARTEQAELAHHEAAFQSNMRRMFAGIISISVLALLFALSFAFLSYRQAQQRAKNLVHAETRRLLEIQEKTNEQLQRANATLQVSEAKLAVTLNSIGDAVIATDAEGHVTFLNPLAEKLTGWTLAEAALRPVDEIFHIINQETREPSTIPVKETLAHGTVHGLANHTMLIGRDGSECAIADSCAPIRDHAGQVVGAVLIFRDVTREYAVQQALNDSAALIKTILQTVADGVITIHARGGIIERSNPAAERIFGYSAEELVGQRFSLLIPELDRDQRNGSLEYYSASEEARAAGLGREVVGRRKDGGEFPLEIAVSEMSLGGQRYFTGVLRDITARRQTEAEQKRLDQRLRDQQFYTRSLIESNIDAIMTTDPSGIITDVNKQMEALTGCTRDELIGAPFRDYFTDPDRAGAAIKLVLAEKKVINYELTARARDGTETMVSYNAMTFYDRDRNLQGVFAAARDITEREHLYQMLQERNTELECARSAAEKANLAKSEFLSSMSHELRTPLNAVLGFAQVMESGTPPPTPSQKRSLDQILKAGWYLLELINEILDLARIESGKMSLSREPVALNQVMLECQAMIEPQARRRGVSMSFPRLDEALFILADMTRIKQVLINLLFNAVKYNRVGGTVCVDCALHAPDSIRISVRDSGEGLAPEKLAQLFQPFNRIGKETGAEEGTGIGLVVTKRLVELMGGAIGVDSTVGTGTVFWIDMSLCTPVQLAGPDAELAVLTRGPAGAGAAPRTLLYVEDNPANLKLVEELITRRPDIRLLCAADGNLGIELAREFLPEVILMDINLPGINGTEAMRILRADPATAHIPIVALSANAMPADIKSALEAGFFRYLTKPIVVRDFMDTLGVALQFSATHAENMIQKEPIL